jgi:hypothetical protein
MSVHVVLLCLVAAGLLLLAAVVLYLRNRWKVFDVDRQRVEAYLQRNGALLEAIKRERQLLNGERENNLALVQVIRYHEATKVLPSGQDLDSDAAEQVIAERTKTEYPKKKRLPKVTSVRSSHKNKRTKALNQ